MQISSNMGILDRISYLTGSAELAAQIPTVPAMAPFSDEIIEFLNAVSKELLSNPKAKAFSDVITFAFWIRKGSVLKLKERFEKNDGTYHLGRGVVFHIAPSNVPVNFAYSLAAGFLCGNANIVRVPSKDFPQVQILTEAFNRVLAIREKMRSYVLLVRYSRDKDINDLLSSYADVRVIWGGDQTIAELRKSPLSPRAGEITFADRYSIAIIDSDSYLSIVNKDRVAEDFYNDTFFSDQNACTSPRVVIWTGKHIEDAKAEFWEREHAHVGKKYAFQAIQGVNKLTQGYRFAAGNPGVAIEPHRDNLIIRIKVPEVPRDLMEFRDNSGYFYEFDCDDIMQIRNLCDDKRCQTVAYIGDNTMAVPLILAGVKGIDRVVPIGKTMDFDLIWDGYDLTAALSRHIAIN